MSDVVMRQVTMENEFHDDLSGNTVTHRAVDLVPVTSVDAYVADARTRWSSVKVTDPNTGAEVVVNTGLASGGVTATLGKGN